MIHAHYHTKRAFIYLNFFEEETKKTNKPASGSAGAVSFPLIYNSLKVSSVRVGVGLFSQLTAIGLVGMALSCTRGGGWVGYSEIFLLWRSNSAWEWAACGGGRVTVPGGVEELCRCVSLRDMVGGHGGNGLLVGLDDLRGLFQPQ